MTSVLYNAAATQALRVLQSTNSSLEETENRISTGQKINSASDNAAYWSISTTLNSDNSALSAVSDALSIGSSTVDTAYQGLESTLDVLDSIKEKLTSASSEGADLDALQDEISQLQDQLVSIASASSFSGENWLSVNSDLSSYEDTKSIVSSFTRDSSGNVTVGSISIDVSDMALVDGSSSGEGILDAGKSGNTEVGGLAGATADVASASLTLTIPTITDGDTSDTLQFVIEVDGTQYTLDAAEVDFNDFDEESEISALIGSAEDADDNALSGVTGVTITANGDGTITITSANGVDSSVSLVSSTYTAGSTGTMEGFDSSTATSSTTYASTATMTTAFDDTITLDANDSISFDVTINGGDAVTVTIDQDTINTALGDDADGEITSADDYATVINQALEDAGISDVTASVDDSGAIVFTNSAASDTSTSEITISSVESSQGVSILDMDVTASDADITSYLNAINDAISKVTSAAATLGAVSSRLDLQSDFVTSLMDTIDEGVSDLVDADMNEESTRLQALQVQQQLGVEALSIANSSAQNILSLFQ
ncbi:flagellin [Consotaella aegiceratis]|uniref:flagellin N-terminal helical domain-containing protein n=1 Tax=Consotaella aegiceratis TaxID=3097961 RepID=UPI002F421E5E